MKTADDRKLVMRLNTQYRSMVRTSLSVHARLVRAQAVRQKRKAIDAAATKDAWTQYVAEQSVPKVADRDNERQQAARSAAKLALALAEAPAPHMDQRIEESVSENDTDSHKVAFEMLMSEQPWSQRPRRPDETGLREAMAGSRMAGQDCLQTIAKVLGGPASLACRLNVQMDAKALLPSGAERLVPNHPISDLAQPLGSKATA